MENLNHFPLDWGVATLTLPGQSESGDRHTVKALTERAVIGVVDGIGHGLEAAAAAKIAAEILERFAHESVIALLNRCQEGLRQTRGAVIGVASFNSKENILTWLGVGNIQGVLFRPNAAPEFLRQCKGLVGSKIDRLIAMMLPISPGDTLVFSTDGIYDDFAVGAESALFLADSPQKIAERIMARYAKGTDDALVLVARYRGFRP
jgi:phosphoserine phosphatase RsbX